MIERKIIKGYYRTKNQRSYPQDEALVEETAVGLRRVRRKRGPLGVEGKLDIAHKVIAENYL